MKLNVLLFSSLIFVSCSVEQVSNENGSHLYSNETTKKLVMINDSIRKKSFVVTTRSISDKIHKLSSADIAGAKAAGDQYDREVKPILERNPLYNESEYQEQKTMAMLAGGAKASYKALRDNSTCAGLSMLNSNMYDETFDYCLTHEIIFRADMSIDTLLTSVAIPDDYCFLDLLGLSHNNIMSENTLPNNPILPIGGGLRPGIDGINSDPTPIDENEIESIFENEVFQSSCYLLIDRIDSCFYQGELDYIQLYESVLHVNDLTDDVGVLFLDALQYCLTTQDVKSLVYNYINTIETYNELSFEDRFSLYGSFIVAIYSFDFWSYYDFDEGNDLILLGN